MIETEKPIFIINTKDLQKSPIKSEKVDRPDVGHKFHFIAIKIGSQR